MKFLTPDQNKKPVHTGQAAESASPSTRQGDTKMFLRSLMLAIVVSLVTIPASHAESTRQNYNRLKKLLDEKYIPKQSPSTDPIAPDKSNPNSITPSPAPAPGNTQQPSRGGTLLRMPEPLTIFSTAEIGGRLHGAFYRVADDRTFANSILVATDAGESRNLYARPRAQSVPSSDNLVIAQQTAQAPAARRERFVVQFSQSATQKQIDAIFAKYQLHSTGGVSNYGILHLERNTQGPNAIPSAEIINGLRKESAVRNAYVDSVMSPNSIPRAIDLLIKGENAIYNWIWNVSPIIASGPAPPPDQPLLLDGNWGLKAIRMPPVWSIVQRYRKASPKLSQPKIAILDYGFSPHEDLDFTLWLPNSSDPVSRLEIPPLAGSCLTSHGSHVLGIVGARFNNGIGMDGIVPDAKIDALITTDKLLKQNDPLAEHEAARDLVFSELFRTVDHYLTLLETQGFFKKGDLRVVINMSQGGNYVAKPTTENRDPEVSEAIKDNLKHQAETWALMAAEYENSVLFVVAAGNDSKDRSKPLDAIYSHPLAWLANNGPLDIDIARPKNILVVEAIDRSGQRAAISNIGGHVAAPGIDILSTLSPGDNAYSICEGTSQAAPHVTGVAALLFELDPSKKPADIVEIIKASAIKPSSAPGAIKSPGAPRFDALEAVLKLSRYNDARNVNLVRLADLNGDGKVDIKDMVLFVQDLKAIEDNHNNGTPFSSDINGDGKIDNNECQWPRSDLNGDGIVSLSLTAARPVPVLGSNRADWEVLRDAWTDTTKSFNTASKETGLDALLIAFDTTPALPASPQACR